jgi:hypothetical protein
VKSYLPGHSLRVFASCDWTALCTQCVGRLGWRVYSCLPFQFGSCSTINYHCQHRFPSPKDSRVVSAGLTDVRSCLTPGHPYPLPVPIMPLVTQPHHRCNYLHLMPQCLSNLLAVRLPFLPAPKGMTKLCPAGIQTQVPPST